MRRMLSLVLVFVLLSPVLRAEEALTNEDVVKMATAGLSDEVVIGKVKEAPQVSFRLGVDDLVGLRGAGVSQAVIGAMLERSKPTPLREARRPIPGMDILDVSLKSGEGETPLGYVKGDRSTAGFGSFRNLYLNYPGLHARARTHDRHPVLLIKSDPALTGGRYFFAKLDPDKGNGVRSLKISSVGNRFKARFGGDRSAMAPDPDWIIPFEATEESPGLWRVTVKKDLLPGEYGWYVTIGAGPQAEGLFGFGVD